MPWRSWALRGSRQYKVNTGMASRDDMSVQVNTGMASRDDMHD